MKWSLKLGQVAGIGIFVHWTFVLLIGYVVFLSAKEGSDLAGIADGILFVLSVFGCIVLHELGHALMARRFGIQTHDITLLPIGGVARLERMPENPVRELLVALAGPAVNVLIAGVLFVVVAVRLVLARSAGEEQLDAMMSTFLTFDSLLFNLMAINVILAVFNLVPAFPMDGGRVLRAVLALVMDYVRATRIAATVGQTVAVLFAILGLGIFGNNPHPFLVLIALFVYIAAGQEAHMVRVRAALRGVPIRQAMVTRFRTVSPGDPLTSVIGELLAGHQQDFPVMEEDQLLGVLLRKDVLTAIAAGKQNLPINQVMRLNCQTVDESQMLEKTFQRMREAECPTVPVLREGILVGLVTLESVGEWMMIQSALNRGRARVDVDNVSRDQ
ncbi:MAG: site-2 protease family protein [Planctomycetes bacterium]|nr:site-2 protease family protein [Planctomycetota bacterium]